MEKVVNSQVTNYLNDNDILTKFYSGFRKNHSTQTALISITDNILRNIDKGLITPTILMDLSKAFDTIDHPLMLQKLLRYGFDTHSMFWFNSYLQNRLQYVKVGNILSNAAKVSCGVPQGSVPGPTLFNLYINEIPAMLKKLSSNDSNIHGYADDLQLYSSCKAERVEETLSMLKDDIYLILEWFSENKLKANPDKFQFIIFGTNKQLAKIPPSCTKIDIQDNLVEAAKEVKILGMQIDQTLSWNSHISHLKKSCAGKLIQMKQIRNCMKRETFSNVVQACVLSSIQYGDIVYGNASKTALHKAQLIQNFAAKVVTGMRKFDHVTPALNLLQWKRLEEQRKTHRLCLLFKCLINQAPQYLSEMFHTNSQIHEYNTRQQHHLHVPMSTTASHHRTSLYQATADFNKLPSRVKQSKTLYQFKQNLKSL